MFTTDFIAKPDSLVNCIGYFFIFVLRICATLWVMIDLLSVLYAHFPARHEEPYFITVFALCCHTLFVAFGLPLLILVFFTD